MKNSVKLTALLFAVIILAQIFCGCKTPGDGGLNTTVGNDAGKPADGQSYESTVEGSPDGAKPDGSNSEREKFTILR